MKLSPNFPAYREHEPLVPIHCITPGEGRTIHRFFDTSPVSPCGRFAALFRLPFEDRINRPGDVGEVILVDLLRGTERVVAETRGWEPQMGCNLNWGADEHTLVFNDVDPDTWEPRLVKLDPHRGTSECIPGGVYQVSPDGRFAAAASTAAMRRTQVGYGVVIPDDQIPRNVGPREDDGLFLIDLETGERRLIVSLAAAAAKMPELAESGPDSWEIYGFHTKWNRQSDRLIFTVRRFPSDGPYRFNVLHEHDGGLRFDVFTCRPDGTELRNAVPAPAWEHGGHHINWCPDGRTLSMNLGGFGDGYRFVRVGHDGSGLAPILADVIGSGHPTVHPDGRHILTDTYVYDRMAFGDGSMPLRWIDTITGEERTAARIPSVVVPENHPALRVDPHPAWLPGDRWVAFNGVLDNTRRVFLADFSSLVDLNTVLVKPSRLAPGNRP